MIEVEGKEVKMDLVIVEKVKRRYRNSKRIPLEEGLDALSVIREVHYDGKGPILDLLMAKANFRPQWGLYRVRYRGTRSWSLWRCSHGRVDFIYKTADFVLPNLDWSHYNN